MKNILKILPFLFALVIFLGHDFIPHHHVEESITHHDGAGDDNDDSLLSIAFSNYQHFGQSTATTLSLISSVDLSKYQIQKYFLSVLIFELREHDDPVTIFESPQTLRISYTHTPTFSLRGPPTIG